MKSILFQFCFVVSLLSVISCGSDDEGDQPVTFSPEATFTVVNNQETMPVWVYGDESSNYLILAVHGGPGSNVLDFRSYKDGTGFRDLESKYQVVYWQQRAAGQSVGSDNTDLFTIDNYVKDADAVVDQLISRYPGKEIILFGHSWGGMLTGSYLNDATRRAKIKAWVDAAGVHNGTVLTQATVDDLNEEADARIQANENVSYWTGLKQQLVDNPDTYNQLAYSCVSEIPEVPVKVNNADFEFTDRARISNPKLFSEIHSTNLNPALSNYTLPVLLLWGQYDFAVSKTLRQEVLENIGSNNVTNITFPASGHYMMFHQPALFTSSMDEFISGL